VHSFLQFSIYAYGRRQGVSYLWVRGAWFRTCGCDQRAFRSPFGNLRGCSFAILCPLAPEGCRGERKAPAHARRHGFLSCACVCEEQGMRLRTHQRAFRSPFGNLRGCSFVILRPLAPEGCRGERKAPAHARRHGFLSCACVCEERGMRLRTHQRAFRSPFGNLRGAVS
jgi:hypothetical protein